MDNYNNPQQQYQQPYYQQPQYQQNMYQQFAPVDKTTEVMSIGDYLKVLILSAIPVVNIICWIVWLASSNTNKNLKHFIAAEIIMMVVFSLISVIITVLTTVMGIGIFTDLLNMM